MDSRITPGRPGELGALLARFDAALLMTRREDDPLRLRGWPIRIASVDPLDRLWFFAPAMAIPSEKRSRTTTPTPSGNRPTCRQ